MFDLAPAILPIANDPLTGTLEQVLTSHLASLDAQAARIATAFLSPDGFLSIKPHLESMRTVQLLLGERPFFPRRGPTDRLATPGSTDDELGGPSEAIDWAKFLEGDYPWLLMTHQERRRALLDGTAAPEMLRALNLTAWDKVRALVAFLERDGVEVRRYLGDQANRVEPGKVLDPKTAPSAHLHAKAYLFSGPSGAFAAVGSSNLTRGGLSDNVELNLASTEPVLVAELEGWFDNKWLQGQDCRQELIDALEQCVLFGRRFTPWQVFLKALDAAYGRFLDLGLSDDIVGRLAEFQQEAVSRCVALLDRHWGAMLCDSVGLGKTYEGLGVLAEWTRRRRDETNRAVRALVVAPAQLGGNWNPEQLLSFGIQGELVTMESLPALLADEDEVETEAARRTRERKLRYLQGFDVVLVDESHNFRNPATKRYQALLEVIRGGPKPDKRVLLMTATPINNSPWDLYHQLSLITRGDDTWYAGRGPIANLRSTFRAIEQGAGGTGLLDAMLLSLVRRTRHDIRALADAGQPAELAGQPMEFPRHEIPKAVAYSLGELYGPIYQQIIDTIQGLHFAVYNLEAYGVVTEAARAAADAAAKSTTEGRVQQRNRTFIGIMRTILLKRMESSVVALASTVSTMVDYQTLFLKELDENARVLTPKEAARLRVALAGSLPDDALDQEVPPSPRGRGAGGEGRPRRAALPAAPADLEERARLRAAVTADRDRLTLLRDALRHRAAEAADGNDPKLRALRALLESFPATDRHGVPTKVVIFTNYKDTADEIFRGLTSSPSDAPSVPPPSSFLPPPPSDHRTLSNLPGQRWVAKLTGADDQRRRAEVLTHFAPLAFLRETEQPDDPVLLERVAPFRAQGIDILIATDVLSEGQNLQDAQYLVNYDLHWNPVRMIQRAGRIDRLFSPHDRIYIHNVMPEAELESLLKLVERLSDKVASIEDMVGLDASVLGEQIESKTFDKIMKLAAGGASADQVYREGEQAQGLDEAFAELNTYIQMVKDLGTDEVRDVPDGVYSVRIGRQAGVFVMLRMPEEASGEVFWRFYPFGSRDPLTQPSVVIKRVEAVRDEPRLELPTDHNPFRFLQYPLQASVDQLAQEYRRHVAEQTQDAFTAKLASLLARDDLLDTEPDLWDALDVWRRNAPPANALLRSRVADPARAVRLMRVGAPVDEVVERLNALWSGLQAEGLDRPNVKPPSTEPTVNDLELVCWELVVTEPMATSGLPTDLAAWTPLGQTTLA